MPLWPRGKASSTQRRIGAVTGRESRCSRAGITGPRKTEEQSHLARLAPILGDHDRGGESSYSATVSCAAAAHFTLRHPVAGSALDAAMQQHSPIQAKPL